MARLGGRADILYKYMVLRRSLINTWKYYLAGTQKGKVYELVAINGRYNLRQHGDYWLPGRLK
jgi:hypothetical protein